MGMLQSGMLIELEAATHPSVRVAATLPDTPPLRRRFPCVGLDNTGLQIPPSEVSEREVEALFGLLDEEQDGGALSEAFSAASVLGFVVCDPAVYETLDAFSTGLALLPEVRHVLPWALG